MRHEVRCEVVLTTDLIETVECPPGGGARDVGTETGHVAPGIKTKSGERSVLFNDLTCRTLAVRLSHK